MTSARGVRSRGWAGGLVGGTGFAMDAQAVGPERGMLNKLRDSAHFFDRKIGLSRIGVALSLAIIVVAAVVLYRILRDLDIDELLARSKRPIGARSSSPACSSPPAI